MRTRDFAKTHKFLGVLRAFCIGCVASLAAVMKAKPDELGQRMGQFGELLASTVLSAQQQAWWASLAFLALSGLIGVVRGRLGDPASWKEIQSIVDEFRADVFGKLDGKYEHQHRVTLYQYRRRFLARPIFSHWLMPYVRSGHTSKSNVRRFHVDTEQAGLCNGIAGRAWESVGAIHVEDLIPPAAGCEDGVAETYAAATNLSVQALKAKPSSSRSFWAVRVEIKGQPWGVFVIDTVNEKLDARKAANSFKKNARPVSLLLLRS